jgi:hypothetical protein
MSRVKEREQGYDFESPEVPEGAGNPEGAENLETQKSSGGQGNPDAQKSSGGQDNPDGQGSSGGQDDPEKKPPEKSGLATIEELAEKLKVGKPILAAVKQSEGWAGGKRVTEEAFKAAIDAFLKAPMGVGKEKPKEGETKPPEGGEQNPPKEINSNAA